jgi:hypothetical protein
MKTVFFPDWAGFLGRSGLEERVIRSYGVVIRWYLGWLKARGERACCANARLFVAEKAALQSPEEWMLASWKAGLRWWFVNAPQQVTVGAVSSSGEKPPAESLSPSPEASKTSGGSCPDTCVPAAGFPLEDVFKKDPSTHSNILSCCPCVFDQLIRHMRKDYNVSLTQLETFYVFVRTTPFFPSMLPPCSPGTPFLQAQVPFLQSFDPFLQGFDRFFRCGGRKRSSLCIWSSNSIRCL